MAARRPRAVLVERLAFSAVLVGTVALVALGAYAIATRPSGDRGTLFFTTFRHTAVYKVDFVFHAGRPQFGTQHLVTNLPGADGIAFEPDGHAVVGGQNLGTVAEVDVGSGAYRSVPSGCPTAFLLALNPANDTLFAAGLPGPLCEMPVSPLRAGAPITLHGDDKQVTAIAFDSAGHAYYTTGVIWGPGNFGSFDVTSGQTTRLLSGIAAGHGMSFDTYTGTLLLFGGETIIQIDPHHPQQVLSSMTVPGVQFDQGTTDGRGHVFAASNFGQLEVVDMSASGRLGDRANRVTQLHLRDHLDDIAPLVGPGAAGPANRAWVQTSAVVLGLLVLGGLGVLLVPFLRDRTRLPSWDVRRTGVLRSRHPGRTPPARRRPPDRSPGRPPPRPGRPPRRPQGPNRGRGLR